MLTTRPEITETSQLRKKPDLSPFLKIGDNCSSKYLVQRYRMQHNFVHFKILRASLLPLQRSQPSQSAFIEYVANRQIDLWAGACYLLILAWFSWVVITAVTPDTLSMGNEDSVYKETSLITEAWHKGTGSVLFWLITMDSWSRREHGSGEKTPH